jgi:hypothetical protein
MMKDKGDGCTIFQLTSIFPWSFPSLFSVKKQGLSLCHGQERYLLSLKGDFS